MRWDLKYSEKLQEEFPGADDLLMHHITELSKSLYSHYRIRLDPNDPGAIANEAVSKWIYESIMKNGIILSDKDLTYQEEE